MSELETQLQQFAADIEWPPTPSLELTFAPRRRVTQLRPILAIAAAALIALAVAFSVPAARSAILRVLHLGGVTVERVDVLPSAQERPLATGLGPIIDSDDAFAVLDAPMRLPALSGSPQLHGRGGVVSVLLATPQPLLLSEFRAGDFVLKKIAAGETHTVFLEIGTAPGLWIAGARHVVVLPAAPARLAGNVLVWQKGAIVYRLEGRRLTRQVAVKLATQITGT